jgi:hypothetical protein
LTARQSLKSNAEIENGKDAASLGGRRGAADALVEIIDAGG